MNEKRYNYKIVFVNGKTIFKRMSYTEIHLLIASSVDNKVMSYRKVG